MNILAFISSFLLLLAIAFNVLISQFFLDQRAKFSYDGYLAAHREIQKSSVKTVFDKLPKKRKPKKTKISQVSPSLKPATPPEKKEYSPECAKFNLWLLLQDDQVHYELFAKLLRVLFKNNLFQSYPEKIEYEIIDEILSTVKNPKDNQVFNDFFLPKLQLKDPKLQILLYKMLKGSKNYHFEKKLGYPSLLDFVKLSPLNNSKAICFTCISKELLIVLFGEKKAFDIWALKEKDKYQLILSSTQFQKILQSLPNQKLATLLKRKHKKSDQSTTTIVGEDLGKTGIRLQKKVSG